jgi:hypothetical protein
MSGSGRAPCPLAGQDGHMPIVLSTVGVEGGVFGPTQPAVLAELPDVDPISTL